MTFFADFADMLSDTLIAQPGTLDHFGGWVASGEALTPACRIEGETRMVRDPSGTEVVSTVQVYVGPLGLTAKDYRFTLPARFSPREELEAIGVEKVADEDGPAYEVVVLP